MRKAAIFSIFLISCFFISQQTHAQADFDEYITDFSADIVINEDSSFVVTETIIYDFNDNERRGIYRYLPYKYERKGTKYNVRIDVLEVADEKGQAMPYVVSKSGGYINVKIGDSDIYISGEHTYVITYSVSRAINYFDKHDELYWNVTGTDWEVHILEASISISLPQAINQEEWQLKCYTGYFGSEEEECKSSYESGSSVSFSSLREFNWHEGLTVIVGWPKDVVIEPDSRQQFGWFIIDNWPLVIPVIIFFVLFYLWYTRGRDPKGRGTVIPIYESPDNLTAGEVGTLVDEKVDLKDISATIIQLAVNGYLKIKEVGKIEKGKKPEDYELIKLREVDGSLKPTKGKL